MQGNDEALTAYAQAPRAGIAGWFARPDREIFAALLTLQNGSGLRGGVAEIGLHHGRSFIALALALREGEMAYGIDIFDQQDLNRDASGRGARDRVEGNLRACGVPASRFHLDARSSEFVTPTEILSVAGPIRFFSIDGGHWASIVKSDLSLADATIAPHGVVALDDFLRSEWPDVSRGFFEWFAAAPRDLVPVAIGFNKIYLARPAFAERYGAALAASPLLKLFRKKTYTFYDRPIPVYDEKPLPEWGMRKKAASFMKLFNPDAFVKLARLRGKV
jgi:hypothetical protein